MHLIPVLLSCLLASAVHSLLQDKIHSLIHSVIEKVHSHGNISITQIFPHFGPILEEKKDRLQLCYSSKLADESVDIFSSPLKEVIHKHMKSVNLIDGYSSEDISQRVHTLSENLKGMSKFIIDCLKSDGGATKIGLTKFSHMTPEEMKNAFKPGLVLDEEMASGEHHHLGSSQMSSSPEDCEMVMAKNKSKWRKSANLPLPESFDYRNEGVVSEIKNQDVCGACWLFASIAAIESAYMIKAKNENKENKGIVSLSEMYTADCLKKENFGNVCKGGQPSKAYGDSFIYGNVLTQDATPYEPIEDTLPLLNPDHCTPDSPKIVTKSRTYCHTQIDKRDDDRLKRLLLGLGPMTVPFRTPDDKEHDGPIAKAWGYLHGPLNTACNETKEAGHLMTVIGWTPDNWIIKNSYGTINKNNKSLIWGEDGYLYLNRTLAQSCGVFGNGRPKSKGGDGDFTGQFTFPILR